MKTTLQLARAGICALLFGLMAACATATPTPIPPTATPPPTAVPPSPTAPSGDSAAQGAFMQALIKTKDATAYRVDLGVTGKGSFAAAGAPTPEANAADEPITLVMMQGEVNGKNAHFIIQGLLTGFLGIPPDQPFEIISYEGVAYFKGPVPGVGATQAKWYQAPPEAAGIAQPPMSPAAFLNSFGEAGINPADFKPAGTETLDGKQCDIYAGDKSAVVNAFSKLGGASGATQEDLDSIENAEFKFWVCQDGYLHQAKMLIAGHDKNKPDQKGAFELWLKLADFDGALQITPPADAELLKLPTPAPEPTAAPTP